MSGATEEVNVKLINFGGTDGIEADVMIDNTTYKIKVSQDDINTAVETGVNESLVNEFEDDAVNRVKAISIGNIDYVHGMGSETIEQQLTNQLTTRMKELSADLDKYKKSYETDLARYKNM